MRFLLGLNHGSSGGGQPGRAVAQIFARGKVAGGRGDLSEATSAARDDSIHVLLVCRPNSEGVRNREPQGGFEILLSPVPHGDRRCNSGDICGCSLRIETCSRWADGTGGVCV